MILKLYFLIHQFFQSLAEVPSALTKQESYMSLTTTGVTFYAGIIISV